jgi:hypothetical protein
MEGTSKANGARLFGSVAAATIQRRCEQCEAVQAAIL